jgi:hypothetical protein
MSKKDLFKGRKFTLSMGIAGKAFNYSGVCLESYGTLCLVQEQKAGPGGRFNSYGIYTTGKDRDGNDQLHSLMIDYETKLNAPPKYGAPQKVVKLKFDDLVMAAKLKESEDELRASQQARENEARAKLQADKERKALEISNKRKELKADLILLSEGKALKVQLSDKKLRELAVETMLLNLLHPEIKK